jgi:hypothetical protein
MNTITLNTDRIEQEQQRLRYNAMSSPARTTAGIFHASFRVFPIANWKQDSDAEVFWLYDHVVLDITTIFCRIKDRYWIMRQSVNLSFTEIVALCEASSSTQSHSVETQLSTVD